MLIFSIFFALGGTACVTLLVIFGAWGERDWQTLHKACAFFGSCSCAYVALTFYAERRIQKINSGKILFDSKQYVFWNKNYNVTRQSSR
jgi:hypothetical protein